MVEQSAHQPAPSPELTLLASAHGIATDFTDWTGKPAQISRDTLIAVLAALDVDASTPEAIAAARSDVLDAPWRRTLPATTVVRADQSAELRVHVPAGEPVRVRIRTESGDTVDLRQIENHLPDRLIDGAMVGEASFGLPVGLPLGYHTLIAESGDTAPAVESHLIVTPAQLRLPAGLARDGARAPGLAAQLYSVRSAGSWGIGDLTDLTDLCVWSARHDTDYVLVNPLHAAEPTTPMEPSPYLPTSRRFDNPIYLRPERIAEYADLPTDRLEGIRAAHQFLTAELNEQDQIERDQLWPVKRAVLRTIYDQGRSAGRQQDFDQWCARQGHSLRDFAIWNVLTEHHGSRWRSWPAELQDPASAETAAFAQEHHTDVDFHCWLQWCLAEQSRQAHSTARDAGMKLGVLHDLAVGVNPDGADTWALGDIYARGITVGAPPDQYTRMGQDWNQPPLRPDRLAETGYRAFAEMIRASLRHGGGVRVDHILGLFRLWWVPDGAAALEGTYVRYPHEAMIGILCLEAHRAGALVVGEDLGTVEPSVRDVLIERGILGTSILWFEKDWEADEPLAPELWRVGCMASVTTHDLPPTAGYLADVHVRLRHELGLLEDLDIELAAAAAEREQWLEVLRERGLLQLEHPSFPVDTEEVVLALHRFLQLTPAKLLNIAIGDLVGDVRAQNQPGTSNEYPNWRIPLSGPDGRPLWLEDLFTHTRAARLLSSFRDA